MHQDNELIGHPGHLHTVLSTIIEAWGNAQRTASRHGHHTAMVTH
ncbi:MAG: hypothetical protein OWU33_16455 [Firmicutes bacterium]|nr:hypothetical protein [Bacillota bacterium]